MTINLHENDDHSEPRVLIVDDEADICKMVAICLNKSGFQVDCAENAKEAHELLQQESYDAIVTDVMMPGEDGVAFLGRVHQTWPDLPVIMMTGHAQLQMAVNAIKNGAFDFVHKPFDFDYMRKIVDRAVNYSKLQRMEKNYRAELEETVASRTTELKEAVTELDFARSALLKSANDKSNFMANISHEMRTPMNGVVGALDLLAEGGLSGIQAEYLAMARQSADNMVTMINQLLTFNQGFGPGGGAARYDLIDLTALLNNLIADQQGDFARKGLSLTLNISADVPHRIWTDREQLSRLLEILLGNALKFSDLGGVTLDASRLDSENEGSLLLFSVTDNGVGIPEGMLERIFEPFVQGDGTFTRRHGGAGLGLSIARQIALLLNGRLWAEHVPGGGSSFKFSMEILAP
ncbi:MAG: response regulator [Desulfuromonadaceae bacterium]|nr:response regulator [Desulfuromonadaceae bacterium]